MTDNPSFPTPPVVVADIITALASFTAAIAEQYTGGPPATASKDARRQDLITLLRQNASYVQGLVDALDGNEEEKMEILLSSGFEAAATTRSSSPLE